MDGDAGRDVKVLVCGAVDGKLSALYKRVAQVRHPSAPAAREGD